MAESSRANPASISAAGLKIDRGAFADEIDAELPALKKASGDEEAAPAAPNEVPAPAGDE